MPTALLPDFLTDIFCGLLGYTGPAEPGESFSFSRDRHVELEAKVADTGLGQFQEDNEQFTAIRDLNFGIQHSALRLSPKATSRT